MITISDVGEGPVHSAVVGQEAEAKEIFGQPSGQEENLTPRTIWHHDKKKVDSQMLFILESFEVKNNQDDILGQNYPKSLIQLISGPNRAHRHKPNLNPLQLFGLQIWLEVKY